MSKCAFVPVFWWHWLVYLAVGVFAVGLVARAAWRREDEMGSALAAGVLLGVAPLLVSATGGSVACV